MSDSYFDPDEMTYPKFNPPVLAHHSPVTRVISPEEDLVLGIARSLPTKSAQKLAKFMRESDTLDHVMSELTSTGVQWLQNRQEHNMTARIVCDTEDNSFLGLFGTRDRRIVGTIEIHTY